MPTQYGESVVMRLLSQSTGLLRLDRLGMPTAMLAKRSAMRCRASAAWCSSPGRPAAARRRRSTPRWPSSTPPTEDHHGRGPGRVPPARHQPGAGERQDRARLRARAALGAAPGPGHRAGRRDARPGHRRDRPARRDDRPPGALDAAHQRRREHAAAPDRHGRAALHGGDVAAARAGPAPGARGLRRVQRRRTSRTRTNPPGCAAARAGAGSGAPSYRHGRGCSHCNGTGYRAAPASTRCSR